MGDPRISDEPPAPAGKEPSGLRPESSAARRRALPPRREAGDPAPKKRPMGLKNLTPSARLRLQLALDQEDEVDGLSPMGLSPMTTSARHRLELALDMDSDEVILPPSDLPERTRASLPHGRLAGQIPFDAEAQRLIRSLMRWVLFCALLTLTVGMLTGLSYLTGPGSVAHVVVGILAVGLSVWLIGAAWSFRRVLTRNRQQHHLVNGLGFVRSALLLKAILLFSTMVLGCFTFSVATAFLSAL